jgi:hypothetical protein
MWRVPVFGHVSHIGSAEFRNTHFSYTLGQDGVEKFVVTPELQSEDSIGSDPLPPGQIWTISPGGQDEHAGLFRIEVTEGPGSGVKILNRPALAPFSESVRYTWGTKPVGLYCSGRSEGKSTLLVVNRPADVWAVAALLLHDPELEQKVHVVAGTHGAESLGKAAEAKDAAFWKPWDMVVFCIGADESAAAIVDGIMPYIPREVRRAAIPSVGLVESGKPATWYDLLKNDKSVESLRNMLKEAQPHSTNVGGGNSANETQEVDPQNLFHAGHLYYPFEQLVQGIRDGKRAEEFRPFILKSDGAILEVMTSPRLSGRGRIVRRLTDGTLISRHPNTVPPGVASWELASILAFAQAKHQKRTLPLRPLRDILLDMQWHLKGCVWLPNEDDYLVLVLGVMTSYAQGLFDAVPLFLAVGPAESGKSELGKEAAKLGCNGMTLSRTSLAAFAETADLCAGFLNTDDWEELAQGKGKTQPGAVNAIQQIVKVCYKKSTATQTRIGNGKALQTRNLFGVKFFTNTLGVDQITATRMFQIRTQEIAEINKRAMDAIAGRVLTPDRIRDLRNQAHMWVFSNIREIDETYQSVKAPTIGRKDEIAEAVRTFAQLAGDGNVIDRLEALIAKRNGLPLADVEQVFEDSIKNIVAQGFKCISAPHVLNEMRRMLGLTWSRLNSEGASVWQLPQFITGKLVSGGWVHPKASRPRIEHDIRVRITTYELTPERIKLIGDERLAEGKTLTPAEKGADSFCAGCKACVYQSDCSILEWARVPNNSPR